MNWRDTYLHYDDDALAVFANVGLLRRARKDVDNDKVTLLDEAVGVFNSDGQQVTLNQQGIQKAQCDCTATGCCKHILAAVLWLQANNQQPIALGEVQVDETEPLLAELLALDPALTMKQVAKADCRLAWRMVQQWDVLIFEDLHSQIKIVLPEYDDPVIYLKNNGFQGMLSSLPEKLKQACHLAVIVKLFNQHQLTWPWPEEFITIPEGERPLSSDEINVIEMISRLIDDLLRQGLSHISRSSAKQLHLLNMSARAEGLPRLAAYLRHLSKQIQKLADKHFTMDEAQVLRFIAQISAYLYQLSTCDIGQLSVLRGQPRRQYDDKDNVLSLFPLDAQWWQVESGAVGATFSFWDSDEKRVIQCTQARANQLDQMFNKAAVWGTLALWKQSASNLMARPFTLHLPRLSDTGKLAASGDSYAISTTNLVSTDEYTQLRSECGFTNWSQLTEYFDALPNDAIYEPQVLHIHHYQQLDWNEIEQCVIWAVNDETDNTAYLRLNWQGNNNGKIEELRFITKRNLPIRAVTVQVRHQQHGVIFVPSAIWLEKEHGIQLFYLDFDSTPRKKQNSGFVSNIQEYMDKKYRRHTTFAPHPSLMEQLTRPIFSVLETQACTGRSGLSKHQIDELMLAKRTVQDLGMHWVAKQIEYYIENPQNINVLLRLIYLCEQLERSQLLLPLEFSQ